MDVDIEGIHPTKRILIQTTVDLLDTKKPAELLVDEVLSAALTSKGSLYHHFADFPELVETALVYRFSHYVTETIDSLGEVLRDAKTKAEALQHFREIASRRPETDSQALRFERIHLLSLALTDTRMLDRLGKEQMRMTQAWEALFNDSKKRGWAKAELDAKAIAVFMQAHVIGQIVNDISPVKMDYEKWRDLIIFLFEVTFFGSES